MRDLIDYPFEYALKLHGMTVAQIDGLATVEVTQRYGWRVCGIALNGIKVVAGKVVKECVGMPWNHPLFGEIVDHLHSAQYDDICAFLEKEGLIEPATDDRAEHRFGKRELV